MSNDIPLFDGEMRIGSAGIFTYCHEYVHPLSKTTVKLIGTNHLGERSYYRKIRQLLHNTQCVFHEYLSPDNREELAEDLVDLRQDLYGTTALEQKFISALSAYFVATDLYFSSGMTMEANAFQNESSLKKWISVSQERNCADKEKKLITLSARIPEQRKKSVVEHVRHALEKIGKKNYTLREYGESFVFFWSDDEMRAVFDHVLSQNQEKFCMQLLDVQMQKCAHGIIGMKFAAAHITGLRTVLLKKGFAHSKSLKLCAISFS